MMQFGLPFDAGACRDTADLAPPAPAVAPASPALPAAPAVSTSPALPGPPELYFARHHRARRYVMRLDRDGRIRVTIPRGGSRREAEAFVRRHAAWVAEQRTRPRVAPVPAAEQRRLREEARAELAPRLLALAARFGLTVTRVSIRNQRSRWGSCGPDGHISLNWRLLRMPAWVQDYVLIHELMHLRRQDHSPAYWRLVAEVCPTYREARQWLRTEGRQLG